MNGIRIPYRTCSPVNKKKQPRKTTSSRTPAANDIPADLRKPSTITLSPEYSFMGITDKVPVNKKTANVNNGNSKPISLLNPTTTQQHCFLMLFSFSWLVPLPLQYCITAESSPGIINGFPTNDTAVVGAYTLPKILHKIL